MTQHLWQLVLKEQPLKETVGFAALLPPFNSQHSPIWRWQVQAGEKLPSGAFQLIAFKAEVNRLQILPRYLRHVAEREVLDFLRHVAEREVLRRVHMRTRSTLSSL